jgi:hypothetical protein
MATLTARRASIVAGLALIPALAFGAVANASPADSQSVTPRPAAAAAHVDPQQVPTIKVHGKIIEVETNYGQGHHRVTTITVIGVQDGQKKALKFAVTPHTTIGQHGHPVPASELTKGDTVTVVGNYLPHQHIGVARHIVIN